MQSPAPSIERLRNIGVVAHIDAGKTTVSERMLFFSGIEHKIGEVDEGTTVLDWMTEERERGITITAAATTVPWREHSINLVDTPGHVDFTMEVERCMRVLDGAVLVLDCVAGVQAQSETVWRQMRRHDVRAVCFVNKCDRPGADFLAAAASLNERLGTRALPIQYPLYRDGVLRGVVDLIMHEAWEYPAEPREAPLEVEVPPEISDEVGVLRSELVDVLAEEDEALLAAVLEERAPSPDELKSALRRRTLAGSLLPVLCGSALKNVGVQPLIDAVIDYMPSPLDAPFVRGRSTRDGSEISCPPDPEAPLCALAFKLHADAHGDLTFVRIYSGTIEAGAQVWNPRTERIERVARLLKMHANARSALASAGPGEVAAVTGLKFTGTGDTLCARDRPLRLEGLVFPDPVISLVLEPRSTADRDNLRAALERIAHEDPSFHQREDEDTGQWLVQGMGELHLEVVLHRLKSEHKIDAATGAPRVAYREALRKAGRGAGRVDKVIGGKAVFGALQLEVLPAPEADTIEVEWGADCPAPPGVRGAVTEALKLAAQAGPRFGYPLVQARVLVSGGESRPQQDSEAGFVQAALMALRQAMGAAQVGILEPVMAFEIQTPSEFASGVIADLNGRRAEVEGIGAKDELRTVTGKVPLAKMFGYSTAVRSLSQGRASFSMQPSGFAAVPEEDLHERGLTWA